jgi:hypothetical protein
MRAWERIVVLIPNTNRRIQPLGQSGDIVKSIRQNNTGTV